MRDVSPKALAATAALRWRAAYLRGDVWYSPKMKDLYDRLVALGAAPNPADVNAAIGNDSWTRMPCSETGCDEVAAVEVGQEPDYESRTAYLCADCLRRAVAMLPGGCHRAEHANAPGQGSVATPDRLDAMSNDEASTMSVDEREQSAPIEKLSHERGLRDGREGCPPIEASAAYLEGFRAGRYARREAEHRGR